MTHSGSTVPPEKIARTEMYGSAPQALSQAEAGGSLQPMHGHGPQALSQAEAGGSLQPMGDGSAAGCAGTAPGHAFFAGATAKCPQTSPPSTASSMHSPTSPADSHLVQHAATEDSNLVAIQQLGEYASDAGMTSQGAGCEAGGGQNEGSQHADQNYGVGDGYGQIMDPGLMSHGTAPAGNTHNAQGWFMGSMEGYLGNNDWSEFVPNGENTWQTTESYEQDTQPAAQLDEHGTFVGDGHPLNTQGPDH